jgi:hypothetical protein
VTERPGYGPDRILRGLGLPRRIALIAVGLAGLAGATAVGVLWATEPSEFPTRTRLSFAALMAVGVAWAAYATSALFRRPWFAIDRLVAGWLTVIFSTLMTVGLALIALTRAGATGLVLVVGLGLPLILVALVVLIRARAYTATLRGRQRDLEGRNLVHTDSQPKDLRSSQPD